jgi:H+/Cl- antiporter ClcA
MPQRKNFWMYDYDQVKYRTPIQWGSLLILSFIFAVFGSAVLWAVVGEYRSKHELDTALLAVGAAFLCGAIIELPASAIFFYRRWRGEITGYFDYEVLGASEHDKDGVHHGPDHR